MKTMSGQRRIVHISNRIGGGTGGLDVAISTPPSGYDMVRIGWSGTVIPDTDFDPQSSSRIKIEKDVTYITCDLKETWMQGFYFGTANQFLWPLFHHRADLAAPAFNPNHNRITQEVIDHFAHVSIQHLRPEDIVIVHDYHLIDLGEALRKYGFAGALGFFLHIPTPSSELMEELDDPEQQRYVRDLMYKLFSYDQVGVQTKRDYQNLMTLISVSERFDIPGYFEPHTVENDKRDTRLKNTFNRSAAFGIYPVIGRVEDDKKTAHSARHDPDIDQLLSSLGLNEIDMFAVDRLDYSKGLVPKLRALRVCIDTYEDIMPPEPFHLLQMATFGRDKVPAYIAERKKVQDTVKSLRHDFGSVITLHQKAIPHDQILRMMHRSRFGLVTPLRDGMNLVAAEYIASQPETEPGVLILSEEAGIAERLKKTVILVDPRFPDSIADGLMRGRSLTLEERREHHRQAMRILRSHSNADWQRHLIEDTAYAAEPRLQMG